MKKLTTEETNKLIDKVYKLIEGEEDYSPLIMAIIITSCMSYALKFGHPDQIVEITRNVVDEFEKEFGDHEKLSAPSRKEP